VPFRFIGAMNAVLPDDIAVKDCRGVGIDFHARYDCKGKEYIYKIWNSPARNPFCEGRYLHYKKKLDASFLNEQAQQFAGKHDFAAFCAAISSVEDTLRTVEYCTVSSYDEEIIFKVKADGFLYKMVRIMVGTLLEIAEGKIPGDSIPAIIESRNRNSAGRTAPPHGLYLNKVFY
ncbi:MAG: tRNA pseudouridine synthase A, partial [Clostridia bacterium]|nr:tRNA pseudouridine synthase A [Clostridia bacterium]